MFFFRKIIVLFVAMSLGVTTSYAQVYFAQYIVKCDSNYLNYKSGLNAAENFTQSDFRRNAFNGVRISCLIDNEFAMQKITSPLQAKLLPKGRQKEDTFLVLGNQDIFLEHQVDSLDYNARFFIDKSNKIAYHITPSFKTTCQSLSGLEYMATKDTKQINHWKCIKWVPTESNIKDEVSIWVCDTIPPNISLAYISDSFPGGVVQVEFNQGFSYNLESYSKSDLVKVPVPANLNCDSTTSDNYNFIGDLIKNEVKLDVKYDFK